MMKSKKAQFYIFTAIVLIGYVMTIAPSAVTPKKPVSTFRNLHENYVAESPKIINNAMHYDGNVSALFENFSDSFMAYAKTRDPNFGLAYALLYEERIYAKNYLGETINITANTTVIGLNSDSKGEAAKAGTAEFNVSGLAYTLKFTEPVQAKVFFRAKKGKEVSIYAT